MLSKTNLNICMRKFLLLTLMLLTVLVGFGQKATLSGYVQDAATGEKLIGAAVFERNSQKGTYTNEYGFFSLTLPVDSVAVEVRYLGFKTMAFQLKLDKDISFNVNMESDLELETVEITATDYDRVENQTQMSSVDISMEKVKSLPVFLGEKDVLKTIQLLPGVQSGSEGTSGIYVRGGGPDQNLILLDGVPVYNASHLFGFFSVFNADAINSVKLIKGGFPARYGGRLSSVIDIRMKEGNMKEFHGEGSVGIISSKLTLEGPIIKDKTSFLVSARRTYIDLLARPIIKAAGDGSVGGYYFYDLNAKLNHKFSESSRLYFSGYFGDDKFYFRYNDKYTDNGITYTDDFDNRLRWGNIIAAVRWNKIINPKMFVNVTGTYSKYRFDVGFTEKFGQTGGGLPDYSEEYAFDYLSGIQDWGAKVDFDYRPSPAHAIKFGVAETYHTFSPGVNQFVSKSNDTTAVDTSFGSQKQYANEFTVYVEDDIEISNRLKMNLGVNWSGFVVEDKFYQSLQPRAALRLLVSDNASFKASYSRMTQFLHLLTNPSIGLPTDLWVPVTGTIPPQHSHQVAVGYAQTLFEKYQLTVEGYYKIMENLIDYKDGASFFGSDRDWQNKVEVGKGWSYGAEVLLEKKVGKTSGWIGYTLSWTNRQFEGLNFGEVFPYRYDRRHDIGIAITHKFNDRVDVGLVYVYGTGNAVTLGLERYLPYGPLGQSFYYPSGVEHIESRNNYRMPSYHRLDLGVNLNKETKWGERTWSFGLYNAYNRQNPFFLYFSTDNQGRRGLYQVSLFPLLPSVSYSFKF